MEDQQTNLFGFEDPEHASHTEDTNVVLNMGIIVERKYPQLQLKDCLQYALEKCRTCLDGTIGSAKVSEIDQYRTLSIGDWIVDCFCINDVVNKIRQSCWDGVDHLKYKNKLRLMSERKEVAICFLVKAIATFGTIIYTTTNEIYYFENNDKCVYVVDRSEFKWSAIPNFLINDIKIIINAIGGLALNTGKQIEIHRVSYYNILSKILYISDGLNKIYRITPTLLYPNEQAVKVINNGDEDVFFLSYNISKPRLYLDHVDDSRKAIGQVLSLPADEQTITDLRSNFASYDDNPYMMNADEEQRLRLAPADQLWQKYFTRRVNFMPTTLTIQMKHILFDNVFLLLFFRERYNSKIIVTLIGEKGSGKSTISRLTIKYLESPKANVAVLPKKEEDFSVHVINRPFAFFDNFDEKCDWLPDVLASCATGTEKTKRKLYTTNDMATYKVDAWLWFTTRTGKSLRRDDLADRQMIFNVRRYNRFQKDADIMAFLYDYQLSNEIFTSLINTLVKVVNVFADMTPKNYNMNRRMADCMQDIYDISKSVFNYSDEYVDDIFLQYEKENEYFKFEDSDFKTIMPIWIEMVSKNPVMEEIEHGIEQATTIEKKILWSSGDIYEYIITRNKNAAIDPKIGDVLELRFKTMQHFCKSMAHYAEPICNVFGFKRKKNKRGWIYDISNLYEMRKQ